MVIVAFMQNMWVREPERVQALIDKYGEDVRRRFIHYALFAGCVSGRRLRAAFGDKLCKQIVWEEASRTITSEAKASPPADPAHITATLEKYKPDVVLAFGKTACDAVAPLWTGRMILAPHPAARNPATVLKLIDASTDLRVLIAGGENEKVYR